MSDESIEQRIQELRLTASRITNEHIDNCIVSESYTILPSGKNDGV